MGHKIIFTLSFLIFLFSIFQIIHADQSTKAHSGALTLSSMVNSTEDIVSSIITQGKKIFLDISVWYHKNNVWTTILPNILQVPLMDFFVTIFGIFLVLGLIIKFLLK